MHTTEGNYFFNSGFLSDYLRRRSSDIRAAIEGIPKAEFDTADDDSVVARVLSDLRVEPLVLDRDSIELSTSDATLDASKDPNRAAHAFNLGPTPLPATRYAFSIPFAGTPELWALSPNTFGGAQARGWVRSRESQGVVELAFTEPKDSKEDLQEKLNAELKLIDDRRDRQRPEVETFNTRLRDGIANAVKARREEFAALEDLAKRMGVKMRPTTEPPVAPVRPRPAAAPTPAPGPKRWDVFVSYAGEDREAVARPLAEALRAKGLEVWFDKFELTLGDHLRRKLDEGLANSRFGVVVLSPSFFGKHWPQVELDGLAQREVGGQKMILPVWHDIDRDGVAAHSPTLADRVAVAASSGMETVVTSVLEVVKPTAG